MSDSIKRKILDLDPEIVKRINILSAYSDTDFKNYCQKLIIDHALEKLPNL